MTKCPKCNKEMIWFIEGEKQYTGYNNEEEYQTHTFWSCINCQIVISMKDCEEISIYDMFDIHDETDKEVKTKEIEIKHDCERCAKESRYYAEKAKECKKKEKHPFISKGYVEESKRYARRCLCD